MRGRNGLEVGKGGAPRQGSEWWSDGKIGKQWRSRGVICFLDETSLVHSQPAGMWSGPVSGHHPESACDVTGTQCSRKTVPSLTSDQISCSVVSDSLPGVFARTLMARPPCPSPTPGVLWDSRPSSQWCHPAISSSVVPFSSCPQFLPASESFPMSQLFAWGGQSTGVPALSLTSDTLKVHYPRKGYSLSCLPSHLIISKSCWKGFLTPERNIRIKIYPYSEVLRRHSWLEERWQWRTGEKKLSEPCLECQGHCHCYPKSYSEEGSRSLLVLGNVETPPKTYTVNCLGMKSQHSLPKLWLWNCLIDRFNSLLNFVLQIEMKVDPRTPYSRKLHF